MTSSRCCFRRTIKFAAVVFSALWILIIPNHAYAKEDVLDKFRIAIGGYTLARHESEVSLTQPDLGAGVSISPQDTLGLNTEQTVFRVDGYYRFNKRHALTYSIYRISSDGNKSMETEIEWIDENGDPITIPAGAQVNSQMKYDIYKLGYLWSFYHTEKVELAAGAGLHVTRTYVSLQAETTSTGVEAKDASVTVPLPVLSFGLTYKVNPKFAWYLKSEIFALNFDDWEGTYSDGSFGVEYRAWRHVGLGIGFGTNSLKVIQKTGEYKFSFSNQIGGLQLYVAGYF